MNEYNRAMLGEHQIWVPDHPSRVQAKSETARVERPPERQLGLRVLASDA
jgi:hypothetical protein